MMGSESKKFIVMHSKEATRALTNLQKEQHPFAFAKSLTQVAEGAVLAVRSKMHREFDMKTEFIPKGVRRTPAKKSDIKNKGEGQAVVFTMKGIDFFTLHEEGGYREIAISGGGADKGKAFAMPGSRDMGDSMETSTGKIRANYKPKRLLQNYEGINNTKRRGTGKSGRGRPKEAFIIKHKTSKTPMIVQRRSKNRIPLKILYVFTRRAKYKPTLQMEKTVTGYVVRAFPTIYKRNMRRAIATAKPK